MEEKKFDPYQFIGFILIALILTWMLYKNGPAEDDPNTKITNTEQVDSQNINNDINSTQSDSQIQQQKVAAERAAKEQEENLIEFFETLEDNDDVQNIFSNANFSNI